MISMCLGNNFGTFFASTCMNRLKGVEVCCSFWVYLPGLKRIIKRKGTLLQAANRTLAKNVNDNIKLKYNALNDKVTVELNNGYELGFFDQMSIILGFHPDLLFSSYAHEQLEDERKYIKVGKKCFRYMGVCYSTGNIVL